MYCDKSAPTVRLLTTISYTLWERMRYIMTQSTSHTALITGASRGLGLALARQLAKLRWILIIDGRGVDALNAVRDELAQLTSVVAIAGDVTDAAHREALAVAAAKVG